MLQNDDVPPESLPRPAREANLEDIARWEVKTNGKAIYEARVDIESSADTFDFYGGVAAAVLQGTTLFFEKN
ncbi:hypothetical protein COOONC_24229 [Cooperia oncophora]